VNVFRRLDYHQVNDEVCGSPSDPVVSPREHPSRNEAEQRGKPSWSERGEQKLGPSRLLRALRMGKAGDLSIEADKSPFSNRDRSRFEGAQKVREIRAPI
jgi:hypothetical protein